MYVGGRVGAVASPPAAKVRGVLVSQATILRRWIAGREQWLPAMLALSDDGQGSVHRSLRVGTTRWRLVVCGCLRGA